MLTAGVYEADAASSIGCVKVDGSTTDYTSLDSLADTVKGLKGKTFKIEMYSDWGNKRLEIPENSNATLNMNGHMYNRGLSSDKSDGEVIWVGKNATLTINGGDKSISHNVGVYNGTSTGTKNDTNKTFNGGVIAGGYSSNGAGGLDVKSDVNLILNDVTIAGCRAEQSWGSDGYGGGIWLHGEKTNLSMNGSTITGCYAYNDGGGIYGSNKDYTSIYLKNSHIDANFCDDEGGGIALDGEKLGVSGSDGSTISGNGSGDDGGGIYLWNDDVSVNGLTMNDNRSGGNGGGICTVEETITLANLNMKGNSAKKGGAIYNENDKNTIAGCKITENSASDKGGGIYVDSDVDTGFTVSGESVIKDNTNGNLYMSATSSRVNFKLARGSDVHVSFSDPGDVTIVTEGSQGDTIKNTNCIRYLTCDDSGYEFTFNEAPDQRKIYLEKTGTEHYGKAVTKREAVKVSPSDAAPEKTGTVSEAGKQYDLIRGYYRYPSMESSTADNDAVFYYSDGFFAGDPNTYNEHLATASWALNMSGGHLHAGGNKDYTNKHAAARQFMADIGCDDQSIYVNDYNTQKPGTDSIGVSIASKELKTSDDESTGYTLIPIAIRGVGYEAEWASNTTLGNGTAYNGEAQGFAEAAEIVTDEVAYYIQKNNLADDVKKGKVKFWISGFSRAGAAANLTAKRLVEKYTDKGNQVFAYPCEAPQGGTDKAERLSDKTQYYCIHNLINYADLVPLVGPTEMGFKRYGVDHYIPGTDAGAVVSETKNATRAGTKSGITTITTYKDNEPIYTKSGDADNETYKALRAKMYEQLELVDSNVVFDDYFHIGAINFIPGVEIYEKGSYKYKEEEFIRDFIGFFQESSIKSRDTWAQDTVKIGTTEYNTIQKAARDTMSLVFSMTGEQSAGFTERAGKIMNSISIISLTQTDMYNVWDDVIGDWHTLTPAKKTKYITFLWDKLEGTGAFDYLSDKDKADLEKNWPTLADMIFNYVDGDYATSDVYDTSRTMTYSGTLAINMSRILQMHNPEINVSWARIYDSYFNEESEEYKIEAPSSVGKPQAQVDGEDVQEGETAKFDGAKTLVLDVPDVKGEAVYYTLKDKTNNVTDAEKLYRGGVDLTLRNRDKKAETNYEITAYAKSRGVKSESATFDVTVYSHNHNITVKSRADVDGYTEDVTSEYMYEEGEKTTVVAKVPKDEFFMEWTVTDNNGNDVTDSVLNEEQRASAACEFVMPKAGDGFDENYSLNFTAGYGDMISEIQIFVPDDEYMESSQPMPKIIADWSEDGMGDKLMVIDDITWSYLNDEGQTVLCPKDHIAYNYTTYVAEFRIPKTDDRIFSPDIKLVERQSGGGTSTDSMDFMRDPLDGSLNVKITFTKTNDYGEDRPDTALTKLTVNHFDLNAQDTAEGVDDAVYYAVPGSTVRIKAPAVESEVFYSWDPLQSGITISDEDKNDDSIEILVPDTDAEIRAQYAPVISRVDVTVDEPVANEPLPGNVQKMEITVMDTYDVALENVDTSWSPRTAGNKEADFSTAYTLYCAMEKINDGVTVTNTRTGKQNVVKGQFIYSEGLEVFVNGDSALCDTENDIVYYTFGQTEERSSALRKIKQPADVFDVAYGTSAKKIKTLLPETAEIVVADRSVNEAPIKWESISQDFDDSEETDESVWTAKGNVELPEAVTNNKDISTEVTVKVHVNGADFAAAPQASIDSGKEYTGEAIVIPVSELGEGESYIIRAVTKKDGLRTSREAYYEYTFTDEIAVPKGEALTYNGKSQIGLYASDEYTIEAAEGSGVTIDADGNATATEAGSYEVTVKIKNGYKWSIKNDETTTDDQTVTFKISNGSIEDVSVVVPPEVVYTGKNVKPSITVEADGVTLAPANYDVEFTGKAVGPASVRVIGKGNYAGTEITETFKIVPKKPAIKKAKAGKRKVTVRMKKKPSSTGGAYYEIEYRVKGTEEWSSVNASGKKKVIKQLKKGKRYQIRVRACKMVDDELYCGAWTKIKTSRKVK
ncbi:MAG: hypothetical protein Q4A65_05465 [Bacillota bacterium]|nr:hypothetical protein [Bacillota bacterium]